MAPHDPKFTEDADLAAACARGDATALRALEHDVVPKVLAAVRRMDPSPAFADEIGQQLRVRLLVREDEGTPPRMSRYNGEVPLVAWMRVIALRLALNAKRGGVTRDPDDVVETSTLQDPELDYLRTQYREPFAKAFERAMADLSGDDRTIMRLHYVDGLNIDGIGRIFGAHRATVARWLVRIRAEVLGRCKVLLAEDLGILVDETESVMGALLAEFDVTLSRLLAAAPRKT